MPDNQQPLPETCGCKIRREPYQGLMDVSDCRYPEALRRIAELERALRAWVKEYGHNFSVGYLHCSGQPCECMRCTAEAALGELTQSGPSSRPTE